MLLSKTRQDSLKPAHKSKTIIFNIFSALSVAGLALMGDANFVDFIGSNGVYITIGLNVINIWLRFQTTEGISAAEVLEDALKENQDRNNLP